MFNCIVCNRPIYNLEDAHRQHQHECPSMETRDDLDCTCEEMYAHPEHCPDCNNPLNAFMKRMIFAIFSPEEIEELKKKSEPLVKDLQKRGGNYKLN